MKTFKITVITIVSIFLIVIGISFILPGSAKVERTIEIKAPSKQMFALINKLENWKIWSPWYQMDTTTLYEYTEIKEGKGASFTWKSNNQNVGVGKLTIDESFPDSVIQLSMAFGEMGVSKATFNIVPNMIGCSVTWTLETNASTVPMLMRPFAKYFYLFMDQMVGPDFEKGLKNLQVAAEAAPAMMVGDFEAEVREVNEMYFIGIRSKLKGAEISAKLGEFYQALEAALGEQSKSKIGVPFTINYSANGDVYDMQAALTTSDSLTVKTPINSGKLRSGKWLVVKYYGAYEQMSPIYQKGFEYLAQNNWKPSAAPMEFYITDPATEPDQSKWLTELAFPFFE
jgi:effector-binding domain-containing protein